MNDRDNQAPPTSTVAEGRNIGELVWEKPTLNRTADITAMTLAGAMAGSDSGSGLSDAS